MNEIWKDIKGYEGLYQISNLGRIKIIKNGKIKKMSSIPKGYLRTGLTKNKKTKYYYPHRLVAEAFIENYANLPCVNHKDNNPKNNKVDNLEWCSYKYNNSYKNHHLKRYISSVLYFLKRDYSNENEIIKLAEELKEKINIL